MRVVGVLSPLKDSSFSRLWVGQSLSRFGDSIISVMLPMVVYRITGSTLEMGLVMTLNLVPQIILVPFTGLIVDRFSRIRLMVMTDIIRFFMLALLAVLSSIDRMTMPVLYGYAIIGGMMSSMFQPAYAAVRAQVFSPNIRNAANSITQISEEVARLIGPVIGGLIVSFTWLSIGFGADALTYLISFVTLWPLKVEGPLKRADSVNLQSFIHELLGGYHELRRHRWLWITILVSAFMNIAYAGLMPILIPWLVREYYDMPAYAYGLLVSVYGIGSLIASIVFGQRQKWNHRGLYGYLGICISGMAFGGMAFISWIPGLAMMMLLNGIGITVFGLIWESSLQEMVPTESYGRVASLDMFASMALIPLGYMVTALLTKSFGGIATLGIQALLVIGLSLLTLLIKDIREFN